MFGDNLKHLKCELSRSFNIMTDSEEGDILFLQLVVIFKSKKKNERQEKKIIGTRIFLQTRVLINGPIWDTFIRSQAKSKHSSRNTFFESKPLF